MKVSNKDDGDAATIGIQGRLAPRPPGLWRTQCKGFKCGIEVGKYTSYQRDYSKCTPKRCPKIASHGSNGALVYCRDCVDRLGLGSVHACISNDELYVCGHRKCVPSKCLHPTRPSHHKSHGQCLKDICFRPAVYRPSTELERLLCKKCMREPDALRSVWKTRPSLWQARLYANSLP